MNQAADFVYRETLRKRAVREEQLQENGGVRQKIPLQFSNLYRLEKKLGHHSWARARHLRERISRTIYAGTRTTFEDDSEYTSEESSDDGSHATRSADAWDGDGGKGESEDEDEDESHDDDAFESEHLGGSSGREHALDSSEEWDAIEEIEEIEEIDGLEEGSESPDCSNEQRERSNTAQSERMLEWRRALGLERRADEEGEEDEELSDGMDEGWSDWSVDVSTDSDCNEP